MNKPYFTTKPSNDKGYINSYDNGVVNLDIPNPDQLTIKGIARGLANNCRWGGQCSRFYSVAQHSVLVFLLSIENIRKEALLHDAHEAYLLDVPKPLKELLPDYQDLEETWKLTIALKFNLDPRKLELVKDVEQQALQMEYEALFLNQRDELINIFKRHNYPCHFWSPRVAMDQYLRTFRLL